MLKLYYLNYYKVMKKIKTLKQLKEDFYISVDKKKVLLYTKEPCNTSRMVHKYLCSLDRIDRSFQLVGKTITDRADLLKRVKEFIESLPYDSEYYHPLWRKECFCQFIIIDWMSSIGFNYLGNGYDRTECFFKLKRHGIYNNTISDTVSIKGLDSLDSKVEIILHTDKYSWVKIESDREPESIKKAVSSLLKPYCLDQSVSLLLFADKLEKEMSNADVLLSQIKEYDIQTQRVELKSKLLELANQL